MLETRVRDLLGLLQQSFSGRRRTSKTAVRSHVPVLLWGIIYT